jgi:hypothetical protein
MAYLYRKSRSPFWYVVYCDAEVGSARRPAGHRRRYDLIRGRDPNKYRSISEFGFKICPVAGTFSDHAFKEVHIRQGGSRQRSSGRTERHAPRKHGITAATDRIPAFQDGSGVGQP